MRNRRKSSKLSTYYQTRLTGCLLAANIAYKGLDLIVHRLHMLGQRLSVDKLSAANLAGLLRIVFVLFGRQGRRRCGLCGHLCGLFLELLHPLNGGQGTEHPGSPLLVDSHVTPHQSGYGRFVFAVESGTLKEVHIQLVGFPQVSGATAPLGHIQTAFAAGEAAVLVANRVHFHFPHILELKGTVFAEGAPLKTRYLVTHSTDY